MKHFKSTRGTKTFNEKKDVSLAALTPYLPWVSLVEPIWGEDGKVTNGRVTLHGTAVAAAYTDNTHRLVRDIHILEVADRVLGSMQHAVDIKEAVIGISEERPAGGPHVRLNILYLPLSKDGKTVNLFFCYVRLDPLD